MTEVVGDYVEPGELRVPTIESNKPTYKGALYLCSAHLYMYNGTAEVKVNN